MARELIIPFLITANYQTSLAIRQLRGELGQLPAELTALRAAAAEVYAIGAMGLFSLGMLAVGAQQLAGSLLAAQRMAALAAVASSQYAAATQLAADILREAASVSRGSATSLQEVAAAYLEAARAGLNLYEASALLPDALKLAVTSGGEASETFRMTFAILRNMGIPITQQTAKLLTSELSYALDQSLMDIEDVMNAIKYVGPIAGQLRVPLHDIFAALMLLHDASIRGSIAGTGLARMLVRLEAPTQQARRALAQLGINWMELRPSARNLADVLDLLAERADELTIRLLLGERAERAFYAIITQGTGRLRELSQDLYNVGASSDYLQKKFDQLMRTPAFRMERAMVDVRTMAAQLTEPLVRLQLMLAEGLRDVLAIITGSPVLQILAKMIIGFGSLGGTIALVSASLSWLIGRFLELGTIWHHLLLVLDRLQAAVRALTLSALKAPFIGMFEFFRALLTGGGIDRLATWISERLRLSELTSAVAQPLVFYRRARRIPSELQPLPETLALQFGSMAAAASRLGVPLETYLMAGTTFAGVRATIPTFRVSKEDIQALLQKYYVTFLTQGLTRQVDQIAQGIAGSNQALATVIAGTLSQAFTARLPHLASLITGSDFRSWMAALQKEIVESIATKDTLLQPFEWELMGIQPHDLARRTQLAQQIAAALDQINASIGGQLSIAVIDALTALPEVQLATRISLQAREMVNALVRNAVNIPLEDLEAFVLSFQKGLQQAVQRVNVQALPFLNEYQRKIQAILRQANVPGILRSFLMGAAALPTDALANASRIALGAMTGVAAARRRVHDIASTIASLANEFGAYLTNVQNVSEAAAEIGIAFGLAAPQLAARADLLRLSRERLARLRELERLRVLGVATAAQIEEMVSLQRQVGLIGGILASTQIRQVLSTAVQNLRSSGLMATRMQQFYGIIARLRQGREFEPLIRALGGLGMDLPEVIGRLLREGPAFYQHMVSQLQTLPDAALLRRLWFRFAFNVMRAQRAVAQIIDPSAIAQIKNQLIQFGMSEAQADDVIRMLQSGILLFLAEQSALGRTLEEALNAAQGIQQRTPFVRRLLDGIRTLFAPLGHALALFRTLSIQPVLDAVAAMVRGLVAGIINVFTGVPAFALQALRRIVGMALPLMASLGSLGRILAQPFLNLFSRIAAATVELFRDLVTVIVVPLARTAWRVLVTLLWANPLVQVIVEFLRVFGRVFAAVIYEAVRVLVIGGASILWEALRVVGFVLGGVAVEFWNVLLRPLLVELFVKRLIVPLVRFVLQMLVRTPLTIWSYGIVAPATFFAQVASFVYRQIARPFFQFLYFFSAWVFRHLVAYIMRGVAALGGYPRRGIQAAINMLSAMSGQLVRLWNRLMGVPIIAPILKILSALVKFPIELARALYHVGGQVASSFGSSVIRLTSLVWNRLYRMLTSRIVLRLPALPAVASIVTALVGRPLRWLANLWSTVVTSLLTTGSQFTAPLLAQLQRVPSFLLGADIIRAVFNRTIGRTLLRFLGLAGIGGLVTSLILDMIPWEDIGRLFEWSPQARVYSQMSGRFIRTLLSSLLLTFVGVVKAIFWDLPVGLLDSALRLQDTLFARWKGTYQTFYDAIYRMWYEFFTEAQRRITDLESSFQLLDVAVGLQRFANAIQDLVQGQVRQFSRLQQSLAEASQIINTLYTQMGVAPPGIDDRLTRVGELAVSFNMATSDLADFAERSKQVGALLAIVSGESSNLQQALKRTAEIFQTLAALPSSEWFMTPPPDLDLDQTVFGQLVEEFGQWLLHGPQSVYAQLTRMQQRIMQLPEEQRRQLAGTLEWIEEAKRRITNFGTILNQALQAPGQYKEAVLQAAQDLASFLSRDQFRSAVIDPISRMLSDLQEDFAEFQKRLQELADPRVIREFVNTLADIQFDYLTEGFHKSAEAAAKFNEYMQELGLVSRLNERSADDLVYAYQAVMDVLSKPAARSPAEAFQLLKDAFSRIGDEAKSLKIDFQTLYQLLMQYNFMQITDESAKELQRKLAELGKAIINAFRDIRETLMNAVAKFKEALDFVLGAISGFVFQLNGTLMTAHQMTAGFIDAAIENEQRATQAMLREFNFRAMEMRRHGATEQEILTTLAADWARFQQSLRFTRPPTFKELSDLYQSMINYFDALGYASGGLAAQNAELNNQLSFAANAFIAAMRIIQRTGQITAAAAEYLRQYYDALSRAMQVLTDIRNKLLAEATKFKEALGIIVNAIAGFIVRFDNLFVDSQQITAAVIKAGIENERRATAAFLQELYLRAAALRSHGASEREILAMLSAEWAKFTQSLQFTRPPSFKELSELNQAILGYAEATGDAFSEVMVRSAEANNLLTVASRAWAVAMEIIQRTGQVTAAAAEYLAQYYESLNKALQLSADLRVKLRGLAGIWDQLKEVFPSIQTIDDAIHAVQMFPIYFRSAIERIAELQRQIDALSRIPTWDAFLKRLQLMNQMREIMREVFAAPEEIASQVSRWTDMFRSWIEQGWVPSSLGMTLPEVRQMYLAQLMWLKQFHEERLRTLMELSQSVPYGTKVWLELNQQILETVENLGRIEEQLRNIRMELLSLELYAMPERVAQFLITQGPALYGFLRTGALGGISTLNFTIQISAQDVSVGVQQALQQAERTLAGFTYRTLF
jgi:TP901 family phage tail tape measure protein